MKSRYFSPVNSDVGLAGNLDMIMIGTHYGQGLGRPCSRAHASRAWALR